MALQSSTKPLIEEALKLLISGPKPLVDAGSDIRMEMVGGAVWENECFSDNMGIARKLFFLVFVYSPESFV